MKIICSLVSPSILIYLNLIFLYFFYSINLNHQHRFAPLNFWTFLVFFSLFNFIIINVDCFLISIFYFWIFSFISHSFSPLISLILKLIFKVIHLKCSLFLVFLEFNYFFLFLNLTLSSYIEVYLCWNHYFLPLFNN